MQDSPDGTIRISRDEAFSTHVDDLLNRQKSLRGEGGLVSGRRRPWYYRNWLVFMLAGAIGAFIAWAILEPYYNDHLYLQGAIQEINTDEFHPGCRGWIKVKGQKVWLFGEAKESPHGDRPWQPLQRGALRAGQEVGVYLEYFEIGSEGVAIGLYVVLTPARQPTGEAAMTLRQQATREMTLNLVFFGVVGGLIGLAIGAADGLVCRLFRRALLGGGVGLLVGFIGGVVSGIVANLAYAPLTQLANKQQGDAIGSLTTFGFLIQMGGRSLAWGLAGMTMGLGHGLALLSRRLVLYGFLGGVVGGLLGGMLFDPIDVLILGMDKPSSHVSRVIGIICVGACVGAMIGLVELLARDAWLRMTEGPLAGKEFLLFKDVLTVGSSPRSDIYLFNDPEVADHHATLRALGDDCEIENLSREQPALVNGRPFQRTRLRHGDRITLGRTAFIFQKRRG